MGWLEDLYAPSDLVAILLQPIRIQNSFTKWGTIEASLIYRSMEIQMSLVAARSLLRERSDQPIRSTPKRQAGNTGSGRVWGKGY